MKTRLLPVLFAAITLPAHAQEQAPYAERVISSELELSQWCEQEARHRYIGKNIPAYNWTSSYYNRDNVLYVSGSLRAHGEDIPVRCRVALGARERYAVIEIDDATLE